MVNHDVLSTYYVPEAELVTRWFPRPSPSTPLSEQPPHQDLGLLNSPSFSYSRNVSFYVVIFWDISVDSLIDGKLWEGRELHRLDVEEGFCKEELK